MPPCARATKPRVSSNALTSPSRSNSMRASFSAKSARFGSFICWSRMSSSGIAPLLPVGFMDCTPRNYSNPLTRLFGCRRRVGRRLFGGVASDGFELAMQRAPADAEFLSGLGDIAVGFRKGAFYQAVAGIVDVVRLGGVRD